MSKMDELRALREARYERTLARAKAARPAADAKPRVAPPEPPAKAVVPEPTPALAAAEPAESETAPQLCGHRNMSGRTCTREHGHAAKSHRYS